MRALTILLFGLMIVTAGAQVPAVVPEAKFRLYNCQIPENIDFVLMDNTTKLNEIKYIVLKPGEYTISRPINLDQSNTWLMAEGVKLKVKDGANCPAIVIGSQGDTELRKVENVRVIGIEIDGNKDNQTSEYNTDFPELRNNCITVRGATNVLISKVKVHNARSGGIVTEKISKNVLIDDVVASGNYFDGVAMYETTESRVSNSLLTKNGYAGLSMDWRADKNVFISCEFIANDHQGIFMRYSRENIFKDCVISRNKLHGAFIAQVDKDESTACHKTAFIFCKFDYNQPNIAVRDKSCTETVIVNCFFKELVDL